MDHAIEIQHLSKTYTNGVNALNDISLTIKKGEFFGLLGPNGAGKSTIIGILCSLVNKSAGTVKILDNDIDSDYEAAKRQVGIVPQEFNFNIFEPCYQIALNQAGYYGVKKKDALPRIKSLFDDLGLAEKWDSPAGQLSGGMKRRLMIARALVHEPSILILDEPTAGVDISFRRSMWTFLEKKNREGLTIILTTHYLEEAESLCERIAIIDKGKIIANDNTQTLLDGLKSETIILYCAPLPQELRLDDRFRQIDEDTLEVNLQEDQSISDIMDLLKSNNIRVERMRNKANRLEELFVKLVEQ